MEFAKALQAFRMSVGPERRRLSLALALRCLRGLAALGPLLVVAAVAGRVVGAGLDSAFVGLTSGALAASVVVAFLTHWVSSKMLLGVARDVTSRVRLELLRTVRSAPVGDVLSRPRGEVTSIIDRDVSDLEDFLVSSVGGLTSSAIAVPVLVAIVAFLDPVVGVVLLILGWLTVMGYAYRLRMQARHITHRYRLRAAQDERVVEFVQGIEVAKAFGLRSELAERLDASLRDYKTENLRSVRTTIPVGAGLGAAASLMGGLLLAVAGWRYSEGAIDASTTGALLILIAGATLAFIRFGSASGSVVYVSAAVTRIAELLGLQPDPVVPRGPEPSGYDVRFEGVEFEYAAGVPVLRGVDFVAPAGSVTAVVGESGAGKSTLLHLLAGLWRPDSGRILVGGVDLAALGRRQRDELMAFVLQDTYFPDATFREAIAGDRSVDDERIVAAARTARCWEFIQERKSGLDARVGEGGRQLSGGERQRLAIARALVADTPIVCLDEATAALDATTERRLREATASLLEGRTVILVAHRPATIRGADTIVVLEDGVVVESGTHQELMARRGVYAARAQALEDAGRRGFSR